MMTQSWAEIMTDLILEILQASRKKRVKGIPSSLLQELVKFIFWQKSALIVYLSAHLEHVLARRAHFRSKTEESYCG
jgi:hypothetical protein